MKISALTLASVLSLAAGLSACTDDYGYRPSLAYSDMDYDVYYDGYYGPLYNGYWGSHDRFFYRTAPNARFQRGAINHFRRGAAPGFNPQHVHSPPGGRGRR